jgi:transcriptional regulator with XRE-family HTH domain
MVTPAREAVPNLVLANLRDAHALTQEEVADRLNEMAFEETGKHDNVTPTTVSKWERGLIERPTPARRRRLARLYGVSISDLGFDRPRPVPEQARPAEPTTATPDALMPPPLDAVPPGVDQRVVGSHQEWCLVRRGLNEHRSELTAIAARLHRACPRVGRTPLLTREDWMLPVPVELADVSLAWVDDPPPPLVTGMEREASRVRPLLSPTHRYRRYTHAIRELVRPGLFENRLSYRLLEVAWTAGGGGRLVFGPTTYFDMLDVCEAVAHELAAAHLKLAPTGTQFHKASWRGQPFRKRIGDPFQLSRRPLLPSIITLTLRRSGSSASFLLHRRDSEQVAVAGSLFHVIPTGVFQPSAISPHVRAHDFDLWRCMLREYSEEFLGNLEHDGNASTPIDYDHQEPFRSLNQARREKRVRAYCFGIGLDPLTLCGEILTAVVIDDAVFDQVFAELVQSNNEGAIVTGPSGRGIALTEDNVDRLVTSEPMAPSGAACLELAWRHRGLLLGD